MPPLYGDRPLIVGESNPYGGDDEFALYPAPDGCFGHRLCCLILGMRRKSYMQVFRRCNLVVGKWSIKEARSRAVELLKSGGRFILLGRKVCDAFGVTFAPLTIKDEILLILPHPSGLNRMWNEDGILQRTRVTVTGFCPELANLLGEVEVRD